MTAWGADTELDGYEQFTIELPEQPTYAHEPEDSLVATLVRRNPPTGNRAVLYVHGWNDYFFQTHLADAMAALGYDFYALDLRRYGRSLRPKQLAGYISKLDDYFIEVDAAVALIREEGHDDIVLMGHSTGGLVLSLYADVRPGQFSALILNSPWLELQATPMLRPTAQPMLTAAGAVAPTTAMPMSSEPSFYHRSISADADGEWAYNHNLKGDPAFLVRIGWMAAIMQGHGRVAAGLAIDCPVLVAVSRRTDFRKSWSEELTRADTVLDVDRIAERVSRLGDLVVLARIEDGLHDLVLSRADVRAEVFDQYRRFLGAYAGHRSARATVTSAGVVAVPPPATGTTLVASHPAESA